MELDYLNAFAQQYHVRQALYTQFEELATELLPVIGLKGTLTVLPDGHKLRFGFNKGWKADAKTEAILSEYRGRYYKLLKEAVVVGAAYNKVSPNFVVTFERQLLRPSYNEEQYNALVSMAGVSENIITSEPSKLVKSFIYCRQQERNLDGVLPELRAKDLASIVSLGKGTHQVSLSSGPIKVSVFEESVPTLIKSHPDYLDWAKKIQDAQAESKTMEKQFMDKLNPKYTPYFSLL